MVWLKFLIEVGEALRGSYVDPAAGVTFPGDDTRGDAGVEQRAQFHDSAARHAGEKCRREDADAGVGDRLAIFFSGMAYRFAVEAEIAAWRGAAGCR